MLSYILRLKKKIRKDNLMQSEEFAKNKVGFFFISKTKPCVSLTLTSTLRKRVKNRIHETTRGNNSGS